MTTQIGEAVKRDVLADYSPPRSGLAQRSLAAVAVGRADAKKGWTRWTVEAGGLLAGLALALVAVMTIELLRSGTLTAPWDGVRPVTTDVTIVDGTFISGDTGWVMAQRYVHNGPTALFKTADGGRTWTEELLMADGSGGPVEMRFWPDGQGMVVWGGSDVSRYRVYRTRDGGATWESFKGSTTGLQVSDFWLNGHWGWRLEVADPRRPSALIIESTNDGGRSWSEQGRIAVAAGQQPPSGEMWFSDQQTGWLTNVASLRVTHDGGRTWTLVDLPLALHANGQDLQISAPVFFGGAKGLLEIRTPEGAYVVTTSDGGLHWPGITALPAGPSAGALFLGPRHWMLADGTTLRETTDAGASWSERRVLAFGYDLGSLTISSDGKAIWSEVGAGGMVRTLDGGRTWTALRLPGAADFSTKSSPVTALSECPAEAPLEPGPNAEAMALAAATSSAPKIYWNVKQPDLLRVVRTYPADPLSGAGAAVYTMCGAAVGSRTWVVELSFPGQPSGDPSATGQLYVSRFADGWKVWYRYR